MVEVRILDHNAIEEGRKEDERVYDEMASQINSAIGEGTPDSRLTTQGSYPFKHYEARQGNDTSKDTLLVSIEARFQDPRNELSGLVVDVTAHQERVFDKVTHPVLDASNKFRTVKRINLIQKYR